MEWYGYDINTNIEYNLKNGKGYIKNIMMMVNQNSRVNLNGEKKWKRKRILL